MGYLIGTFLIVYSNVSVYHRPHQQHQQQPHQPQQQQHHQPHQQNQQQYLQQQDYGNIMAPSPQSPYYSPVSNAPPPPQQNFQSYQPYYSPAGAGASAGGFDPYFANIAADPMMNMARAYGEQFAEQSKQKVCFEFGIGGSCRE